MTKTITPTISDLLKSAIELHQQGKLTQARQHYQQILLMQPDHFDAMHFLGVIAKQNGSASEAITLIQHALDSLNGTIKPVHASAFCNLGAAYQDCGQTELAVQSYLQAIELKPDYAIAHNNLGNALKALSRFEDALQSFQNALVYAPNYAEAYYNAGLVLLDNQQLDAALRCFERAIEIKPAYTDAFFARGNVYQQCRQHEQAVRCFDQAIALRADFAKAYLNRGISCNRLALYEQALQSFELAIQYQPRYANAFFYKGNTLKQLQRFPDAIAAYQRAIDFGADAQQVAFALATLGIGSAPPAPPNGYVRDLFDQYADHFDEHLVDVLHYEIPHHLAALIEKYRHGDQLVCFDLGCGTGLCGKYLRPYSATLTGVDLSQNMLDKASQLSVYDNLVCAELTDFLNAEMRKADLIVAADVLVYLGDLQPFFQGAHRALNEQGLACFSVEDAETNQHPYLLKESNRYAHAEYYLRALAQQCGFAIIEIEQQSGRQENQRNNKALIVMMQKTAVHV